MKLEIKYNKTVLREFQGKLKMREKALPTLKNKEAALRAMVFETRKRLRRSGPEKAKPPGFPRGFDGGRGWD